MLTEKQRDYLIDGPEGIDTEPKSQKERDYRANIRNRVKEALEDFDLLASQLELRDVGQIFYDPNTVADRSGPEAAQEDYSGDENRTPTPLDETPPTNQIPAVLTFLYLGTISQQKRAGEENPFANDPQFFESLVKQAIHASHTRRGELVDTNVDIEVEIETATGDIDTSELESLSHSELGLLYDNDEITTEQYFEALDFDEDEFDVGSGVLESLSSSNLEE
ncbi:hypothetical protein DVK00_03235 [Haloarcula sp. Atlit-47R]|uniref:hypothetical protein n=1 Tax=Haloarcula sp. Atlit-47R TaxID=2282132 RepID=UPI000EF1CEBF|nr:hypothetical protein [Haloarcula sp. Atlit-47R]RLM47536.1 hypothetical protein DVK00_03235 [Haloarcula sp. Atlit-47R]